MNKRIIWNSKSLIPDELIDVSNLRKTFIGDSERRSLEANYYKWKIVNNYFMQGKMWAIYDKKNAIGMASFTPKKFKVCSEIIIAAEIGDTFTNPNYQRQGIFSILVNSVKEDALKSSKVLFLYGTPNESSLPGYEKKLNFLQSPSVQVANYIYPVKIKEVVSARFGQIWKRKFFNVLLQFIYKGLLRPKKSSHDVSLSEVDDFPQDIYSLLRSNTDQYDIIMVRDYNYLKWRFISNPDKYSIWIVYKLEEIIGYIVTKTGKWKGLQVLYIADYLMKENNDVYFHDAILRLIEKSKNNGIDLLSCWAVKSDIYAKQLRSCRFFKIKDIPIICYSNNFGKKIIKTNYKWHFTMADSDNI